MARRSPSKALLLCALLLATVARAAPDFSGIWLPDPLRAKRWSATLPLSTEGRKRVEAYRSTHDPQIDDPGKFCVPSGMPSSMTSIGEYPIEILQSRRQVTVLLELHAQQRRIFTDGRATPDNLVPSAMGYSNGRWDGNTLVVKTHAIKEAIFLTVPRSDQMTVEERWKLIDGGKAIHIDITVTDPVLFSAPLKAEQVLKAAPADTMMMEYDCTEGAWQDHLAEREAARR